LIELLNTKADPGRDSKPRLIRTIETKDSIEKGLISAISTSKGEGCGQAGLSVQALIDSVSLACFKALTLPRDCGPDNQTQANVSREIAEALFYSITSSKASGIDEKLILSMLHFNVDKD